MSEQRHHREDMCSLLFEREQRAAERLLLTDRRPVDPAEIERAPVDVQPRFYREVRSARRASCLAAAIFRRLRHTAEAVRGIDNARVRRTGWVSTRLSRHR